MDDTLPDTSVEEAGLVGGEDARPRLLDSLGDGLQDDDGGM